MIFEDGIAFARRLDLEDPLAIYKSEFYYPDGIYLDGNSLGLLHKDGESSIFRVLTEWKVSGIKAWGNERDDWFHMAERVGELMSISMGAKTNEVVAMGSTTTNLHTLVYSFYNPTADKSKVLADSLNFPSDIYALKGILEAKNRPASDLMLIPSKNGHTFETSDILNCMTSRVALMLIPSVLYRSGQLLDIGKIAERAQELNIVLGLDCSHSAGALRHHLHDWDVDFAFWCGYKYLNGGPGSSAFLFVNEKHFNQIPHFRGWWGNNKRNQFEMDLKFSPAEGAHKWQISTPNIISLATLESNLRLLNNVGIEAIRSKSISICNYLIYLVQLHLEAPPYNFKIITPLLEKQRSGHIAISHEKAFEVSQLLRQHGIVPDYRPPNIIRLAPVAWYNSFEEVYTTVMMLKEIVDNDLEVFEAKQSQPQPT